MTGALKTDKPDNLLTEVAAGRFMQLSVRTLQAWRSQGIGPAFIRLGRAVRYRHADLVAWLDANRVEPEPRMRESQTAERANEALHRSD